MRKGSREIRATGARPGAATTELNMVGALSLSFAPVLAFSAGPPAFTYTPSSMRPVVMMTPVETELALKQEALDAILAKIDPAQLELTLDVLKKQVEIAQLREIYISKTATEVPIIQAPAQAAESIMPAIAPVLAPAPPVVEAPAALAQAAEIMTPKFQSLPATEPFVKASEMIIAPPAMEQAAAVAASAPADDFQLPIMAFGIAFTVFPAAVIGISKILENPPQAPPAPKAVPSMPTAGGATGGIDLGSRSADEIFISVSVARPPAAARAARQPLSQV